MVPFCVQRGCSVLLLDAPPGHRRWWFRRLPPGMYRVLCASQRDALNWFDEMGSDKKPPTTVRQFLRQGSGTGWYFVDGVPALTSNTVGMDPFTSLLRRFYHSPVSGIVLAGDTHGRCWSHRPWGIPPWVCWMEAFPETHVIPFDNMEDAVFGLENNPNGVLRGTTIQRSLLTPPKMNLHVASPLRKPWVPSVSSECMILTQTSRDLNLYLRACLSSDQSRRTCG